MRRVKVGLGTFTEAFLSVVERQKSFKQVKECSVLCDVQDCKDYPPEVAYSTNSNPVAF